MSANTRVHSQPISMWCRPLDDEIIRDGDAHLLLMHSHQLLAQLLDHDETTLSGLNEVDR